MDYLRVELTLVLIKITSSIITMHKCKIVAKRRKTFLHGTLERKPTSLETPKYQWASWKQAQRASFLTSDFI